MTKQQLIRRQGAVLRWVAESFKKSERAVFWVFEELVTSKKQLLEVKLIG